MYYILLCSLFFMENEKIIMDFSSSSTAVYVVVCFFTINK